MAEFCRMLRAVRTARNLSQAAVGEAAGVTRNHYQLMESGKGASGAPANPRFATIRALAEVLGVPMASLVTRPRAFVASAQVALSAPPGEGEDPSTVLARVLTEFLLPLGESPPRIVVTMAGRSVSAAVQVEGPDERVARVIGEGILGRGFQAIGESRPETVSVSPGVLRVSSSGWVPDH